MKKIDGLLFRVGIYFFVTQIDLKLRKDEPSRKMSKRGHDDDETSIEDNTKKKAGTPAPWKEAMAAVSAMLVAPKNPAMPPAPKNPAMQPAPKNPATPTLSAPTPNPVKNHPYSPSCYNCLKNVISNLQDLGSLELVLLDYPCLKSMKDHRVFGVIMDKAISVNRGDVTARVLIRNGIYAYSFNDNWLSSVSTDVVGEVFKTVQDDFIERGALFSCLIKRRGIKFIVSLISGKHVPPLWQLTSLILQSLKERETDLDFFDDFKRIIVRCCEPRENEPMDKKELMAYCYTILSIFNRDEWRKTVDLSRIEEPYYVFPIINLLLEIITRTDSKAMKIIIDKPFLMNYLTELRDTPIKPEAVLFLLKFNCSCGSTGSDSKKTDV